MIERTLHQKSYVEILRSELERRHQAHPRYSMRAFARDLSISPAQLSLVLNGKKGISEKAALKIAERLSLTEAEKQVFCDLAIVSDSKSRDKRREAHQRLLDIEKNRPSSTIALDAFRVISDWYHFAIMELTCQAGFVSSVDYIQDQLGISKFETEQALERLENLELLEKIDGRWHQTTVDLSTTNDIPSEAIRKFHMQVLEKAMQAIQLQPIDERDIASSLIGIHRDDLPRYKAAIRDFHREVSSIAESRQERTNVYCLGTQFFKLTKGAQT